MPKRASIFEDLLELDVSEFAPKKHPDAQAPSREEVRAVSEAAQFRSREASQAAPKAPASPVVRRYRTGRNVQLNLKVSQEARQDFYAITDAQKGWVLGYTFERAIQALKRELEAES